MQLLQIQTWGIYVHVFEHMACTCVFVCVAVEAMFSAMCDCQALHPDPDDADSDDDEFEGEEYEEDETGKELTVTTDGTFGGLICCSTLTGFPPTSVLFLLQF